jgi:hypothetical protein
MTLKKPKRPEGKKKAAQVAPLPSSTPNNGDAEDETFKSEHEQSDGEVLCLDQPLVIANFAVEVLEDDDNPSGKQAAALEVSTEKSVVPSTPEIDPDDPIRTIPLQRYNAMLAVLRNTLYMYVHHSWFLRPFVA